MEKNSQELEQLADAVTKGLAYTENGGKPDTAHPKAGKTGETKSIFQFTPDTWKNYAKQVLGDENTPLDADSEAYVVHSKVSKWLQEGKSIRQIASMWNAGSSEPDAYTGKFSDGSSSVGTNKKYNVKFDVPQYADKVDKYTQEFMKGKLDNSSSTTLPTEKNPKEQTTPKVSQTQQNPQIGDILSLMKSASVKPSSIPAPQAQPNSGLIKGLI